MSNRYVPIPIVSETRYGWPICDRCDAPVTTCEIRQQENDNRHIRYVLFVQCSGNHDGSPNQALIPLWTLSTFDFGESSQLLQHYFDNLTLWGRIFIPDRESFLERREELGLGHVSVHISPHQNDQPCHFETQDGDIYSPSPTCRHIAGRSLLRVPEITELVENEISSLQNGEISENPSFDVREIYPIENHSSFMDSVIRSGGLGNNSMTESQYIQEANRNGFAIDPMYGFPSHSDVAPSSEIDFGAAFRRGQEAAKALREPEPEPEKKLPRRKLTRLI